MQVLLLQLGGQHYALPTREVVRVLPAMRLARLPRAPAFIAGIMNYHGMPVPVLDLTRIGAVAGIEADLSEAAMTAGGAQADTSDTWYDTRIVLIDLPPADTDPAHATTGSGVANARTSLLGLRAEHVTGTRQVDPARIAESGVSDAGSPFLGRVISGESPLLQLIETRRLLPAYVARWLQGRMAGQAC